MQQEERWNIAWVHNSLGSLVLILSKWHIASTCTCTYLYFKAVLLTCQHDNTHKYTELELEWASNTSTRQKQPLRIPTSNSHGSATSSPNPALNSSWDTSDKIRNKTPTLQTPSSPAPFSPKPSPILPAYERLSSSAYLAPLRTRSPNGNTAISSRSAPGSMDSREELTGDFPVCY